MLNGASTLLVSLRQIMHNAGAGKVSNLHLHRVEVLDHLDTPCGLKFDAQRYKLHPKCKLVMLAVFNTTQEQYTLFSLLLISKERLTDRSLEHVFVKSDSFKLKPKK